MKHFGTLEPPRRSDPLEELVLTVLSQNTSDANSFRAYESLRARFPTWEALAAARPDLVTMEPWDTARHTKEWNVDPDRWERSVAAFVS